MAGYMMGDANKLDHHTRRNMVGADIDLSIGKLIAIVAFFAGMLVGSILHDSAFHAIEQVMK